MPGRPTVLALLSLGLAARAAGCDLCAISTDVEEEKRHDAAPTLAADTPLLKPSRLQDAGPDGGGPPARNGAGGEAQESEASSPIEPPPRPPKHPRLALSAGIILQQLDQERARIGTRDVDDPAQQYLRTTMAEAVIGARFGERFGLRAYLPYLHRSYQRSIPSGVEQGSLYGPGDSELEATALALRHVGPRAVGLVTLIAGVKAPTGWSDEIDQEGSHVHGETTAGGHVHVIDPAGSGYRVFVHPHDLALGTGSWDGIFGVQSFWRLGRAYATARALYALRTPGTDDFRAGDELSWGGGPGCYLLQGAGGTLGLLANVTGEARRPDHLAGQRVDDSGATEVFIGPDLSATWRGLSAEAGVDLPVFQRVDGAQLVADYRVHLGASWSF